MDYNRINKITTFIFDVDGVLTDSQILITESGDLLRSMSTRDGQAIKFAIDAGYHVAIIRGTDVDKPRNLAKSVTVE